MFCFFKKIDDSKCDKNILKDSIFCNDHEIVFNVLLEPYSKHTKQIQHNSKIISELNIKSSPDTYDVNKYIKLCVSLLDDIANLEAILKNNEHTHLSYIEMIKEKYKQTKIKTQNKLEKLIEINDEYEKELYNRIEKIKAIKNTTNFSKYNTEIINQHDIPSSNKNVGQCESEKTEEKTEENNMLRVEKENESVKSKVCDEISEQELEIIEDMQEYDEINSSKEDEYYYVKSTQNKKKRKQTQNFYKKCKYTNCESLTNGHYSSLYCVDHNSISKRKLQLSCATNGCENKVASEKRTFCTDCKHQYKAAVSLSSVRQCINLHCTNLIESVDHRNKIYCSECKKY